MLKDTLKQEIDRLGEPELREIAQLITSLKQQHQTSLFWQQATPAEREKDFRTWVKQLPPIEQSLPDEACDRTNII